ncbi:helix-turn-helix domain-containing protein [Orenia marismortui]|uniref:helix-turn-helix domain-containing protein n=1 Tax=Orenia marismortui TaxID=46469 RepID=UPI00036EE9EF|nr:XRE family transcriptional regulator [Orenia marismortui]
MDNININIAKKLNQIRKNRGFTLSKLEELTGVSKSMLGQIERGESNPTVKTLWKIANGLNVSFSTFIDEDNSKVSVISTEEINPLLEERGEFRVYPIFPFDHKKRFEIHAIEIEAGCSYEAEAHFTGVEEHLIVSRGILEILIEGDTYRVNEGNTIRFVADKAHVYRNDTDFLLKAHAILYYPVFR